MSEQMHSSSSKHASPGHETRDARPRPIVISAVILLILIIVVQIGLIWMFRDLLNREKRQDQPLPPQAANQPAVRVPQLQSVSNKELLKYRASERTILEGYGWVDKQQGIVRIPVARAMEILAERGLPTPVVPPEKNETPSSAPQPGGKL